MLGIIMESNLKMNEHFSTINLKFQQKVKLFKCIVHRKWGCHSNQLQCLYNIIFLSVTEYALPISINKQITNRMETLHYQVAKKIIGVSGKPNKKTYTSRNSICPALHPTTNYGT